MQPNQSIECDSWHTMHRRRWLGLSTTALAVSPWTMVAEKLARADAKAPKGKPARSVIMLWLQGGPSQLETFDPHPDTRIGGETKAIETSAKGIQIAHLLPQTALQMHHACLIRSMVSKEGDHERATYNLKTGWRPDPTLLHPSIGGVLCHQSQDNLEIPRHVSILGSQWPARGGYMGPEFDAFLIGDPRDPLPNLKSYLPADRQESRLHGLKDVVERQFARGRLREMDRNKTLHETSTQRAIKMMESAQIAAFDISQESKNTVEKFGDTPFGRGCLAAIRLIETGVRCVEIELNGWDTHVSNFELQSGNCKILDAALAGLIDELHQRGLLDSTLVFCGGEFGRTPTINPAGGRDHWPTGFSSLLVGGGVRKGLVYGETPDNPKEDTPEDRIANVANPVTVEDLHATMLHCLGINPAEEMHTPIGRPLALSKGRVLHEILES